MMKKKEALKIQNGIRIRKAHMLLLSVAFILYVLTNTYFVKQAEPLKYLDDTYINSDDFNFKLNFGINGKEQIDTYGGTYTKDLVKDGVKTIHYQIPGEEKENIRQLMEDIDIFSFPAMLKVYGMGMTPSCDYKLTVTMDGITKTIQWEDGFIPGVAEDLPEKNLTFLKLVKYISDYLYDTKEYKQMPSANGCYD